MTSVLTHHLGWVPTVTPGSHLCLRPAFLDGPASSCSVSKISMSFILSYLLWPTVLSYNSYLMFQLSDLPKVHPYNPLWAQAMDLYGALGNPLKTSRTIIMSMASNKSRIETIEKILRIVSYFIRCAAIERQDPKLEEFNLISSLSSSSSASTVTTSQMLSTFDCTSPSSACSSASGKCPSLPFSYLPSMINTCDSQHKPKTLNVVDSGSCKSENSLIAEANEVHLDSPFKKSSNVGLRRTMSYSSKMTTSALIENKINNEKQSPLSVSSEKTKEIITSHCLSDKVTKLHEFGSSCPNQRASQESCTPFDKVIFVLGENENLIGLKGKPKITNDEMDLNTIEERAKMHEQPLSFSGSEVESGFSECESFELSPVRTGCSNLVSHTGKTMDSSVDLTSNIQPSRCCSKNEKNNNSNTCSMAVSQKGVVPFHEANPRLLEIQSTLIQCGKQGESFSVTSANLRSLARSLSVNLPVCMKTVKHELSASDMCVSCGDHITCTESKENMHPERDLCQTCCKKNMRKLRRAHSSFCVQSQTRKYLKSSPMCHNCKIDEGKSFIEGISVTTRKSCDANCADDQRQESDVKRSNIVELPLPTSVVVGEFSETVSGWGIAGSLFGGVSPRYMPERVLQGCAPLGPGWEMILKRDLLLDALHPTLDPGLTEAVAIVANVDSW